MEQHNPDYADRPDAFADSGALQFALREVQGLLRRPGFWIVLAAAIAILVVSGPSDTLTRFNAAERTAYWATIAFSTFVTGQFATVLLVRLIRPLIGARMPAIALGALLAALPITAEVWLVNFVFPDSTPTSAADLAGLYGMCLVITLAIATIYDVSSPKAAETDLSPAHADVNGNRFLKRIPARLGTEIVSLQAQDHYLEVTTTKGRDLILMRLSDAEAELAGYPGMRVHRSWWVARSGVDGIETAGDRMTIRLVSGTEVPVSRANRAAVRSWVSG